MKDGRGGASIKNLVRLKSNIYFFLVSDSSEYKMQRV